MEVCGYSRLCPGKRSSNEDAAAVLSIDDQTLVLILADGCGGKRGGQLASQALIRSLARSLRSNNVAPNRLRERILAGIEEANQEILSWKMGAACTAAVVEIHGSTARSYYIGDSKILIASPRARVRFESICHSPVGYAVASGLLSNQQAIHREDRNIVSNVVGCRNMRIEMGPAIELRRGDQILLASDGLDDNLLDREILKRMQTGSLKERVSKLAKLARHRMLHPSELGPSKPDDLTILLARRISS